VSLTWAFGLLVFVVVELASPVPPDEDASAAAGAASPQTSASALARPNMRGREYGNRTLSLSCAYGVS
jgi:hypothetical protein